MRMPASLRDTLSAVRERASALASATKSAGGSSSDTTPRAAASDICPVCNGTGWLRVERELSDPRFGKLEPCECQADRALEHLRSLSGLHGAELQATLDELDPTVGPGTAAMVEACRRFMEAPTGFLTLWGQVGTGKSLCLCAITNALLRRGAVYISLHDLLDFARQGFDASPGDDAAARLRRFMAVPVLCLDELDKVKESDWVQEQLTALVDARFRSGVAGETGTVFALNSDPAELSPWIASRLRDGRACVVYNGDPDARPFRDRQPAVDR
jgi:DNA replication protein DnaC